MRRSAYVLGLLIVSLLAVACGSDAEEDVPGGGDEEFTAEETFDEVLRATAALQSVQIEWTQEPSDREPYTGTEILTREGTYLRQGGGLEGFEEVCADQGAIVEPSNICDLSFGEMLWLGDRAVYYRDKTTGEWVLADDVTWSGDGEGAIVDVDVAGEGPADDEWVASDGTTDYAIAQSEIVVGADLNGIALDFGVSAEFLRSLADGDTQMLAATLGFLTGAPTSIELGPQVSHGDRQLQALELTFAEDLPDMLAQLENLPPAGEDAGMDSVRAQIEAEMADSPRRMESTVTLLVDEDFRPRSADATTRMYAEDERLLYSHTMKSVYSLWNEAELPGPLPAR